MPRLHQDATDDNGLRLLEPAELATLLLGETAPPLYVREVAYNNWICRLISLSARITDQIKDQRWREWHQAYASSAGQAKYSLTIAVGGSLTLPDAFDAKVFGVLVAQATQRTGTDGGRSSAFRLLLHDILADLHLDTADAAQYKKVIDSVRLLCTVNITATSDITRSDKDATPTSQTIMFSLFSFAEFPDDAMPDFADATITIGWTDSAFRVITTN